MIEKTVNIYKKYEEVMNYLIMGVLTTIVSIATKYALLFTILDAKDALQLQIAIIISWIISVIFAYVTNRKLVFKSNSENIFKEFSSFVIARIVTLLLEMFIMWFFITLLKMNSNTWVIIWTLVSQVLIIILNYVFSKLFIFRGDK